MTWPIDRYRDHDGIVHLYAKSEGGVYVRCERSNYTGVWSVRFRYATDLMFVACFQTPATCVQCLGARDDA